MTSEKDKILNENSEINGCALDALRELGCPGDTPESWNGLAKQATHLVKRDFPDASFSRIKCQVMIAIDDIFDRR